MKLVFLSFASLLFANRVPVEDPTKTALKLIEGVRIIEVSKDMVDNVYKAIYDELSSKLFINKKLLYKVEDFVGDVAKRLELYGIKNPPFAATLDPNAKIESYLERLSNAARLRNLLDDDSFRKYLDKDLQLLEIENLKKLSYKDLLELINKFQLFGKSGVTASLDDFNDRMFANPIWALQQKLVAEARESFNNVTAFTPESTKFIYYLAQGQPFEGFESKVKVFLKAIETKKLVDMAKQDGIEVDRSLVMQVERMKKDFEFWVPQLDDFHQEIQKLKVAIETKKKANK